jgi:hypothetical protein
MDPNLVVKRVSLLTWASTASSPEAVPLLLERGARFDRPGNESFLTYNACVSEEMFVLGFKNGLDINARPRRFGSPLEKAVAANDAEWVEFLIQLGARVSDLRFARWFAVSSKVILLLAEGGAEVPANVLKAVKDDKWDPKPSRPLT